jgi:three-Cys-motif partner protein
MLVSERNLAAERLFCYHLAMATAHPSDPPRQPELFDRGPSMPTEVLQKALHHPIWTENKAKLIERYLYYFVMITKHGTYIDAFAGPQSPGKDEMWAAKLVLESEPRWFRDFFLYEKDGGKVQALEALRQAQPVKPKRTVSIERGDSNVLLRQMLGQRKIRGKEATFCLLDQRTFECEWQTVVEVARYKGPPHHKIEVFYFLANSWLCRALAAQKDTSDVERWWGRADWERLREMSEAERLSAFVQRFKTDLGYASVKAYPIFERQDGGHRMYYMIHATDHPAAPSLMHRAYERAVRPKESMEQLTLFLETVEKDGCSAT